MVSEWGRFGDSKNWGAASNLLAFFFDLRRQRLKLTLLLFFLFQNPKQRRQVSAISTTTARRGATRTSTLPRQAPSLRLWLWEGSSAEGTVAAAAGEGAAAAVSRGTLLLERFFFRVVFSPETAFVTPITAYHALDSVKKCLPIWFRVPKNNVEDGERPVLYRKKVHFFREKTDYFTSKTGVWALSAHFHPSDPSTASRRRSRDRACPHCERKPSAFRPAKTNAGGGRAPAHVARLALVDASSRQCPRGR